MFEECLTHDAKRLFPLLTNFRGYHLVGGTALALQIGHRESYDFDLFTEKLIDPHIFTKIKKIFPKEKITPIFISEEQRDYFISGVKVTFRYFPFKPGYLMKKYQGFSLLSVKDIAAAKAFAIGKRAAYRDYIDMYYILKEGYATMSDVVVLAEKTFSDEFNARLFLEQLVYLGDITDTKVSFLRAPISKSALMSFLKKEVRVYVESFRK